MTDDTLHRMDELANSLADAGFRGEISRDTALRAALSTDNSVYRITPDLIVAPFDAEDVVILMAVAERPEFMGVPVTARGGGTGTNGQSLNSGVVLDMRRHMHRLLDVDPEGRWADVEPGIVLDDLNEQLRPHGLFFAPETSTSNRCAVGGMVSTDASGKGSRVYGKTSDNLLGLEIARGRGLVSSLETAPDWALPMLEAAESAARSGRDAFIASTPDLNRRFTGYDLDRSCPVSGPFEWWRLFPGSEGTLGPITRIRVRLLPIPRQKRLIVAGFDSFRKALASALPLAEDDPTAIEVMDERVQALASDAGILDRLPEGLRVQAGEPMAYTFIEFHGEDEVDLEARMSQCRQRLQELPGLRATHLATDPEEIRNLWSIRSAGVGLLGRVDGRARPVAFVEDCVVPPEGLPGFLDGFLEILARRDLDFGIYGHVDVGCLHIRPALNIDTKEDRRALTEISDEVFDLVSSYGGIFWGEHGKGVRGAYLEEWIGPEAYRALQGVKTAFDPSGRFNPGKLISTDTPVMGIGSTPFRTFNSGEGDPLERAFRCNGNAQCHSYAASTHMCPSFKATADPRQSPKGRADALRAWHEDRRSGTRNVDEADVLAALDTCLGCKACTSTCPVNVDIPTMRAAFLADYHARHRRPLADHVTLLGERFSPLLVRLAPVIDPLWPMVKGAAQWALGLRDLPGRIARPLPRRSRVSVTELSRRTLPPRTVLVWQDWFSALFDSDTPTDILRGLTALGYRPLFVEMLPSGKAAADLGDRASFGRAADRLLEALRAGAAHGVPMVGVDPAFVMALRQDYPKSGRRVPEVLLVQEFLAQEVEAGVQWPAGSDGGSLRVFTHCTETTGAPHARENWVRVLGALGMTVETPAVGCCGMAGMFGHKARHQPVSRRLFEMSWSGTLDGAETAAATGFSCRSQMERLSKTVPRHPLGLIADRLEATGRTKQN
ncbi:FAD-binding and (Fe-S)-binding domain-containing protein [Roseicyclus sp. F158]|uniref:FAD-binding and (Fe-S)-binding domain-containing protein n=1 Tax=Tropicimonas omnivorans TaxID=3075590 RepID=A0ABU3DLK1_9RHOB|nr:FAD-binding and (Fe-S)-binding domain-containing protein [Roseicyclus sp. F158]MDT0684580.1 FAD-binding and (Fe-S)-binding domain-containing protein [Roseicyclus sp. F158]